MRFSLINPPWSFEGSIYFGCREPHLPLEYGYSKVLLERAGHDVQIVDAQLDALTLAEVRDRVADFRPDFTVVTTAPSYLFWRCAPPELRIPQETVRVVRDVGGTMVAVGPHASTTPKATLRKLDVDVAILGECEEILPQLTGDWDAVHSLCYRSGGEIRVNGGPHSVDMTTLPALHWNAQTVARHAHHHHRFDAPPQGPGAEMETSRGCPYHCTFCAKDNFRNSFRRRPVDIIGEELDNLIAAGARYVYFIDEIFLPYRNVLETIAQRGIPFGIQTRIDLWSEEMIDLLGTAGCVSIEAGVESITEEGREWLDKKCKISTAEISERLIRAKLQVPFVQANLLDSSADDPAAVAAWRAELHANGVWANEPVPLFPYPGSPDYTRRWGPPDDLAWERAHAAYLGQFDAFSDIQEQRPVPLVQLELAQLELVQLEMPRSPHA
ncbi:MAG: Radical domain protein [Candidatus Solibacter sp.]|nr:Radical domain protein [Candidatus Solibacter sp.]